jgi:cell division septation protein DedD
VALLAIFVGYLIGNWLIQVVTGNPETGQKVTQEKIIQEEIIEENTNNENQPDTSETSFNKEQDKGADSEQPLPESQINESINGQAYVVQVGAFNKYDNALTLKNKLENEGFQVVVNDDQVPYKVQLGATKKRTEADKTKDKLKSLGYDAFVTH